MVGIKEMNRKIEMGAFTLGLEVEEEWKM